MFYLYLSINATPELNNGKQQKWFKRALLISSDFQEEVDYWRSTVVGRYCMELYGRDRDRKLNVDDSDQPHDDKALGANNKGSHATSFKSNKIPAAGAAAAGAGVDAVSGGHASGTTTANPTGGSSTVGTVEAVRHNGLARATSTTAAAAAAAANSNPSNSNPSSSNPVSTKKTMTKSLSTQGTGRPLTPAPVSAPAPNMTLEQQEQHRQAEINRQVDLNLIMGQGKKKLPERNATYPYIIPPFHHSKYFYNEQ